jgi:hypothetical protein
MYPGKMRHEERGYLRIHTLLLKCMSIEPYSRYVSRATAGRDANLQKDCIRSLMPLLLRMVLLCDDSDTATAMDYSLAFKLL